ncbi:endonuclease/exonuclease/phosphatase family protein [Knoellia sp. S7-12]|uniref:endonuclease/exonuclease/phosphatase family protein n=1 Tax=Knoellia sp. S7-12 TaxID=3126698 RepID=UPI00336694F2
MTRSRVRHVAGLAAAGIALTGAIGVTATTNAPPAEAAPGSIRIITHNLEKEQGALDAVKAKVAATDGPEVVLLQEVCESLLPQINDMGHANFRPRKTHPKCGEGQKIGEAVVWTGGNEAGKNNPTLVKDAGHRYGLACVTFRYAGRSTRACSTHLAAGEDKDGVRTKITRDIRAKSTTWIGNGHRVIVGGDFNSNPQDGAMDHMYGVGGGGAVGPFRELHQMAGEGTTARAGLATKGGRKIDYIFVSERDTRPSGGTEQTCNGEKPGETVDDYEANHCTTSDHRLLWGTAKLKSRG